MSNSDTQRQALAAIRHLKEQVTQLQSRWEEPVAIVGMACRFPGGIRTPEALWNVLLERRSVVSVVPESRWRSGGKMPDVSRIRHAGLVDDLDCFDSDFFGFNRQEADRVDPQQRMLLETSWEALERGGFNPKRLAGSRTGVFLGLSTSDYLALQLHDLSHANVSTALGADPGFAAGRIACFYDFHGPTIAVNTFCSSSLVALELAVSALRGRQADLALVGGANAIVWDPQWAVTEQFNALSPTGQCRPFDEHADGFVRAEGAGMLVLQRLADAQDAGAPILAVIRGIAVNHDGTTAGLTVPNGAAQQALLTRVVEQARIDVDRVGLVEAHGTGTPVGDPIEVDAIASVYGRTGTGPRCALGAIKSNLGHLEAAAGVAGVMKVVLSLGARQVPPNANFERLNPRIRIARTRLFVPTDVSPWPSEGPRLAALSAFGLSGTNAHCILEEAPQAGRKVLAGAQTRARVIKLSARTADGVEQLGRAFASWIEDGVGSIDRVAPCNEARADFEYRAAVAADSPDRAREALRAVRPLHVPKPRTLGLLLDGEGTPRIGTGRAMYDEDPLVRDILQRVAELVDPARPRPLLDVMWGDPNALKQPQYARPAQFALQVAVGSKLAAWGVHPWIVLGAGVGELAALVIAKALSLEDAVQLLLRGEQLHETVAERVVLRDAACRFVSASEGQELDAERLRASEVWRGGESSVERLDETIHGTRKRWPDVHWLVLGSPRGLPALAGQDPVHLEDVSLPAIEAAIARAYEAGVEIDWSSASGRATEPSLPTYPFQKTYHWLTPPRSAEALAIHEVRWERLETLPIETESSARGLVTGAIAALEGHLPGDAWELVDGEVEAPQEGRDVVHVLPLEPSPWRWIETLQSCARARPRSLVLVTRGAFARPGEPPDVAAAACWGAARSAAWELQRLQVSVRRVDVPKGALPPSLAAALRVSGAPELVFMDGQWCVPKIAVHETNPTPKRGRDGAIAPGLCLVTGGTGGLGLRAAQWLVELGASHVVLLSRHGIADDDVVRREAVERMRKAGATVSVERVDLADKRDVEARIAALVAGRPVAALVHAAGATQPTALLDLDEGGWHESWDAKVRGLQQVVSAIGQPIPLILGLSSVAGVWGARDFVAYAAAGAALDATLVGLDREGQRAISLRLGPCAGPGMAEQLADAWAEAGVHAITPDEFSAVLGRVVRSEDALPIVVKANWRAVGEQLATGGWDLIGGARASAESASLESASAETTRVGTGWRDTLAGVSGEARRETIQAWLLTRIASLLPSGTAVEDDKGFFDLGLDSFRLVELRRSLEEVSGFEFAATVAIDFPSVRALTEAVLERWVAAPRGPLRIERQRSRAVRATSYPEPMPSPEPSHDAIAIVGMACRFPGEAEDLEGFWRMLCEGRDAVTEPPRDRWSTSDPYAASLRPAGFVRDVAGFDPMRFGISPREAPNLDPQQRMVLEVCWHALEDARMNPRATPPGCGVFVGAGPVDYGRLPLEAFDPAYFGTGTAVSALAGRVAHGLGLSGPSATVDAACASSLVALHQAVVALRLGDCDMALVAGVNLLLASQGFAALDGAKMLAPDGRCKTFSGDADGYGRGEGCGVLVLKPYRRALADGDRIYATILGTATNSNGGGAGLTVPNGRQQVALLERALDQSGLHADDVDYVEAHGTGTALGDPIEVAALEQVFSGRDRPLFTGSVKTNVGHLEAAAGIAGVIKTVLCIHRGQLVSSLHAEHLNPRVPWTEGVVEVLRSSRAWPERPRRIAGVSSFGFTGTNAHCTLASADEASRELPPEVRDVHPVLVTAPSPEALGVEARRLAEHLEAAGEHLPLQDLAFSLATTRAASSFRLAIPVALEDERAGYSELRRTLLAFAADQTLPAGAYRTSSEHPAGMLAVLFSGQGSQRLDMGRQLYRQLGFEVFTQSFDDAISACDAQLGHALLEILWGRDATRLAQTRYTQPGLFAVETALYRQWEAWGLRPKVFLGHSLGELVAAHVAGVFSLEDAAKLVCARGRLMDELAEAGGTMVSVEATEDDVRQALAELTPERRSSVDIAGLNAPCQTVLSGDAEGIERVLARLEGKRAVRLSVSHAFHSPHMDSMLAAFATIAREVSYRPPAIPILSNVTGAVAEVSKGELVSPEYWVQHIRHAVRFCDAVRSAKAMGVSMWLECGPGAALCGLVSRCLENTRSARVWASLRQPQAEMSSIVSAWGGLHVHGHPLPARALFEGLAARRIELPRSVLQRERFWIDAPSATGMGGGLPFEASVSADAGPWPLAGRRMDLPAGGVIHAIDIGPSVQSYLGDHLVYGAIVVPGAFHVAVLLSIAAHHYPERTLELLDVQFHRAIRFDRPDEHLTLYAHVLPPDEDGRRRVTLASSVGQMWTTHAVATLGATEEALFERIPVDTTRLELEPADPHLDRLDAVHVRFENRWRWLTHVATHSDHVYGRLSPPAGVADDDAPLPAGLIDNTFIVGAPIVVDGGDPFLPFRIDRVVLGGRAVDGVWARGAYHPAAGAIQTADFTWFDARGEALGRIEGFTLHRAPKDRFFGAPARHDALYGVQWLPVEASGGSVDPALAVWVGPRSAWTDAAGIDRFDDIPALIARLSEREGPPRYVLLDARAPRQGSTGDLAIASTLATLADMQALLSESRLEGADLVWITEGAVAVGRDDPSLDLVRAPLVGLLRSARSEHPDRRIRLLDLATDSTAMDLWSMLAADHEPELARRRGAIVAPRLAAIAGEERVETRVIVAPERTALICGFGGLGQTLVRHLVKQHGVRHLVLASRRGVDAPGAGDLVQELERLGAASVRWVACDTTDRASVQRMLDEIPPERPLDAVFHLAGVLDDGLLTDLSGARMERVMRPKVLGASILHELTQPLDLSTFVLFSSIAGVLGAAGQSNYAAANAFLETLAAHRRAQGLPAQSLAWGPWDPDSAGMTTGLDVPHLDRLRRQGIEAWSIETGMSVFDAAQRRAEPTLVPIRIVVDRMQRFFERAPHIPAILRSLVRAKSSAALSARSSIRQDLLALPAERRLDALVELVQHSVAAVLGLPGTSAVPPEQPIKDLGLDSLMAVELRNQLAAHMKLPLPATLAFDHPTPRAIARLLLDKLPLDEKPQWRDAEVRAKLGRVSIEALRQRGLLDLVMTQPDAAPMGTQEPALEVPEDDAELSETSLRELAERLLEKA